MDLSNISWLRESREPFSVPVTISGQVNEIKPLCEGEEYAVPWIRGSIINLIRAFNAGTLKPSRPLTDTGAGKTLTLSSLGDELQVFILAPACSGTPAARQDSPGAWALSPRRSPAGACTTVSITGAFAWRTPAPPE